MERLKELRAKRRLSQARLAARAGLDPSTVNQIERGAREASPATLRKLAEALDVSLAELLGDDSPKAESRSSLEPSFNDVLEEERRFLDQARPLLRLLDREAPYWERVARSGRVSPDVRAVVASHRLAVMEALDVLLEKHGSGASRLVRRELQSAFGRWNDAWHALEDAFLESLAGGELEEARQALEEQEERSQEVYERLRAGEAG